MFDSDTAILNADTLLSSLRFTQKHSHSILTLTQTNSIWLKLIHSHLTWWWQPSWILPLNSDHLGFIHLSLSLSNSDSHLPRLVPNLHKRTSFIHSDSTWWWQPSWILPYWIQPFVIFLSNSLENTSHTMIQTNSIWLKLIHSDSTWWWQPSWILPYWNQTIVIFSQIHSKTLSLYSALTQTQILTQVDDGSHLDFSHISFLKLTLPSWLKKRKPLIDDSTWWWQPSWILPSWIQPF